MLTTERDERLDVKTFMSATHNPRTAYKGAENLRIETALTAGMMNPLGGDQRLMQLSASSLFIWREAHQGKQGRI